MKRLSDYKGEEALELWADLLEPMSVILQDKDVRLALKSETNRLKLASKIIKKCKKETEEILLRIDDTPLDGMNIVMRLVAILADIGNDKEIQSFFGSAVEVKTDNESFGSATENTEAEEK